ncbi:MAG: Asp-tRNA(Asn)/Glu-tRNA(Gln) amidotransferase subunit GatB [Patescibacteria group bacterium UBA2163]
MAKYTPTIGLEIHAELKTKTKMFCRSANDPHAGEPNTHICPVCMAFPGTLPVINKSAVAHVLRVGAAIEGTVADYTEFDRKNYFYPDLPKGYQISQYKYPLISGGSLAGVEITRIHLEEDTARSQHTHGAYSLVDFNRAGVPLMELVTEPVIHDAETASRFAQELQLLLRTLGVSDANMEKGEMRVEANISISKDATLGTKVEVKNLNSFKAMERAVAYEIERHTQVLEEGGTLVQETRGWDENSQSTFSQRMKEESHDYRYFPDPDLPKLKLSDIPEFNIDTLKADLPELPWEKRERYTALGVKEDDAVTLTLDRTFGAFFDAEVLARTDDVQKIKTATNYLLSDVRGSGMADALHNLEGGAFMELIDLVAENSVSSRGAKDILTEMLEKGGRAKSIAEARNLMQVHDTEALRGYAQTVIKENPEVAEELKQGKESVIQFLIGQGMKVSKGAANPKELATLIKEELGVQ